MKFNLIFLDRIGWSVKRKVSSNAKQFVDIKSAPMTAEPNEPKVGESFAEKLDLKSGIYIYFALFCFADVS